MNYTGSITDMTVSEHHDATFKIGLALERLRACEHKTERGQIVRLLREAIAVLERGSR